MPALGGSQPYGLQFLDYSNERKSFEIFIGELTAISLPGALTLMGAFYDAVDDLALGEISRNNWGERTYITNTPPTNKYAQIETEVLVTYRGATTESPFSFRIPTADYNAFNWVGDSAILTGAGASAATTAFKTAFEALAKSPDDEAEAVELTGIFVVK